MKTGVEEIADERKRHVEEEGFDAEHDDRHEFGELAWAAVCFVAPEPVVRIPSNAVLSRRSIHVEYLDPWPADWDEEWDKRETHDRIKQLKIAGALIAAEIDRLKRAAQVDLHYLVDEED